jgi:histidine triad (HIT) family protein
MMARSSSLKTEFLSLLLTVARWYPLRPLAGFLYRHINRFLPVDRLCENAHWTAFHHPQPDYPLHILILPKQEIPSMPLAPCDDPSLYADLFLLVNQLIEKFDLEAKGYRLITNGGLNQSIPVWHWHLVCEASCKGSAEPGDPHA